MNCITLGFNNWILHVSTNACSLFFNTFSLLFFPLSDDGKSRKHTGGNDYDELYSWLRQCRCTVKKVRAVDRLVLRAHISPLFVSQLKIQDFPDTGRGVVATEDIQEGEQLLSISERHAN